MKIVFNPTAANFDILRKRLIEFKNDFDWGADKIIDVSYRYCGLALEGDSHRHSLNKFIKKTYKSINDEMAGALWKYFIEVHPNETLNSRNQNINLLEHKFSHALSDFFSVDSGKMASIYSNGLQGRFCVVRRAWRPKFRPNLVSVGELIFNAPRDQKGTVIEVKEYSCLDDQSSLDKNIELASGYGIIKGINFNCLLKTSGGYMKLFTIESFSPVPEKGIKFKSFHGSSYATIGNGPHKDYRFYAKRLNLNEKIVHGVVKFENLDSDMYNEYDIDEISKVLE